MGVALSLLRPLVMDPFAVLRVNATKFRKESNIPKLKEQAKKICKEYEKTGKKNKIAEVERAYQQIREQIKRTAGFAGSKAFNTVMVNDSRARRGEPTVRIEKPKETPATEPVPTEAGPAPNPEAPFAAPVQGHATRKRDRDECVAVTKREDQIREKLAARRQMRSEASKESEQRRAAIAEKMAAKRRTKQGTAEDEEKKQAVLAAGSSGPGDCQQGRSDVQQAVDEQRDHAATTGVLVDPGSPRSGEDQGDSDDDALPNAEDDPYGAVDGGLPMSSPLASSPVADCAEDDVGPSGPSDAEAVEAMNADEDKEANEVEVSYF